MWSGFNIITKLQKYCGIKHKTNCTITKPDCIDVINDKSIQILCESLANAIERRPGQDEQEVNELVNKILNKDRKFSRLGDILARWHLEKGRPNQALNILENLALDSTSSIRLLANICRCIANRRTEAFIDLLHWMDDPSCPVAARVLFALLQIIDNANRQVAVQTLIQNIKQIADPVSLQLLILINVEAGRIQEAEYWLDKFSNTATTWINQNQDHLWLTKLGMSNQNRVLQPPAHMIEVLAVELQGDENLIPSLVAAQYHSPDASYIQLLRAALKKALPELEQQISAIEALAQLAIITGDYNSARTWINRGLEQNPLSVPLAIMLSEISSASMYDVKPGDHRKTKIDYTTDNLTVVLKKELGTYTKRTVVDKAVLKSNPDKNSNIDNSNFADNSDDANPVQVIYAVAKAHPDWPDLQKLVEVMEAA